MHDFNSNFSFGEVFANYEDFKITQEYFKVDSNLLDEYFFNRLYRKFFSWQTDFDTVAIFCGEFFNLWEDGIKEVTTKKEYIDMMYDLNFEDISRDFSIATFANNPNDKPQKNSELLEYFNSQNYSESNARKSEAIARFIQIIPQNIINNFVERFTPLFSKVFLEKSHLIKRNILCH